MTASTIPHLRASASGQAPVVSMRRAVYKRILEVVDRLSDGRENGGFLFGSAIDSLRLDVVDHSAEQQHMLHRAFDSTSLDVSAGIRLLASSRLWITCQAAIDSSVTSTHTRNGKVRRLPTARPGCAAWTSWGWTAGCL